jgi:hypothetical protein
MRRDRADIDAFTTNRIGTAGHEIRDPSGLAIAWTATEPWALIIAGLLNRVEAEGVGSLFGSGDEAPAVRRETQLGCPNFPQSWLERH